MKADILLLISKPVSRRRARKRETKAAKCYPDCHAVTTKSTSTLSVQIEITDLPRQTCSGVVCVFPALLFPTSSLSLFCISVLTLRESSNAVSHSHTRINQISTSKMTVTDLTLGLFNYLKRVCYKKHGITHAVHFKLIKDLGWCGLQMRNNKYALTTSNGQATKLLTEREAQK